MEAVFVERRRRYGFRDIGEQGGQKGIKVIKIQYGYTPITQNE